MWRSSSTGGHAGSRLPDPDEYSSSEPIPLYTGFGRRLSQFRFRALVETLADRHAHIGSSIMNVDSIDLSKGRV